MADGFAAPSHSPASNGEDISPRLFSVAELDAMFDAQILSRDEKLELIDGELFKINSQMMPHGVLKMRLALAIASRLPADKEVLCECSVRLDENNLVDPDIVITPRLQIERRYMRPDEVFLAIEVADTSLDYDVKTKARVYARAGISEHWVVDINNAQTWVHREPNGEGYASITKVPFADLLASISVAGLSVLVKDLLT